MAGFLRQSVCRNVQSPMAFSRMSVRFITSKLLITDLSSAADDQSLRKAFSNYGDVIEAKVVLDEKTGKSLGRATVTYNNLDSASSAMLSMDGQELHGQKMRIRYYYERNEPRTFGGSTLYGGVDLGYNLENPNF